MQLEYGENAPDVAADNMAAIVNATVNPEPCEVAGEGDDEYYRAVGQVEKFTGSGEVRGADGSVTYRGQC